LATSGVLASTYIGVEVVVNEADRCIGSNPSSQTLLTALSRE
jgi:hypothetical protein